MEMNQDCLGKLRQRLSPKAQPWEHSNWHPKEHEACKFAHEPRRGWNCASNEGIWRGKNGETILFVSPFGNLRIGMSEHTEKATRKPPWRPLVLFGAEKENSRFGKSCRFSCISFFVLSW